MWPLSGLIYLSLPRCIVLKPLWRQLGEWKQRKRECLRYLSPQIFFFTLSACKSGLEKQFRKTVNKRWWKWKMHGAWPMWFWDLPTHTVWAYMPNYLSRNKDHKSSSCSNISNSAWKDSLMHRVTHCTCSGHLHWELIIIISCDIDACVAINQVLVLMYHSVPVLLFPNDHAIDCSCLLFIRLMSGNRIQRVGGMVDFVRGP